jgi:hypothetical protein
LLELARSHGIPIINGRAYHPQTQGSVEKANGIFKARLFACQKEAGSLVTEWVRFLSEIALCVNTTRPSSLPAYVTPFYVWFGREPHFLRARPLNEKNEPCDASGTALVFANGVDDGASDTGYPNPDTELLEDAPEFEKLILNAIEERIRKNNVLVASRMVKKTTKKAQIFKEGWIVTLAIPKKMRLSTEPKRLPVRILGINNHNHMLISRFGRIRGAVQPAQLNVVESNTLGLDIPIDWPENGPKILLTQAVQLFNNRGSIASIQKANRDIEADKVKANKAVVEALESVAKWVAKLPPVLPNPDLAPASPSPEVEQFPRRLPARRGTKRQHMQVDADAIDSAVDAQIIGEIAAVTPALGRGKRVRISRKSRK